MLVDTDILNLALSTSNAKHLRHIAGLDLRIFKP
jgi:hypothetical protein